MPPPDSPQPSARRTPWKWILRLLLGIAAVWLLARGASEAPLSSLKQVSPALLAACIAAYWIGQALSARRWQILLLALSRPGACDRVEGPDQERVGWRECVSWYAAGMFWNLWMPTGLGGDAARAVLAGRRIGSMSAGALSVVLDRALGLACLLALAAVALLFDARASSPSGVQEVRQAREILLASAAAGAFAVVVVALFWKRLPREKWARAGGARQKVARSLDLFASGGAWKNPRVLVSIALLSLSVQAIQIGINIALARAVGLGLPASSVVWAAPVLALSSVVPLGIGGLGAREVGAVALLGASFGRGEILAWSLAWQGVVWASSLLGAPSAWRWRRFNAPPST